jgi:hypothetical protein
VYPSVAKHLNKYYTVTSQNCTGLDGFCASMREDSLTGHRVTGNKNPALTDTLPEAGGIFLF